MRHEYVICIKIMNYQGKRQTMFFVKNGGFIRIIDNEKEKPTNRSGIYILFSMNLC